MSEKSSPKKSGGIPMGPLGLVFTIIYCVALVMSPVGFYSVFLAGAFGFAGLVISILAIARGSGRAAGVIGILVFIVGCLMTFTIVLL